MRNLVSAGVVVALFLVAGAPSPVTVSAQNTKKPAASAAAAGVIEIGEGKDGKFRFFVRDGEGDLLAMSSPRGFASADDTKAAIQKLKEVVRTAKVTALKKKVKEEK
jgi:hypothetical protein